MRNDRTLRGMRAMFYLQEIELVRNPGEKLGLKIRGGGQGHIGNPLDLSDDGIFISKV